MLFNTKGICQVGIEHHSIPTWQNNQPSNDAQGKNTEMYCNQNFVKDNVGNEEWAYISSLI